MKPLLRFWRERALRHGVPCVGLVIFLGCGMFIVTPDSDVSVTRSLPIPANILPTIVIDPGHGGADDGANGHGWHEKDLTLDIAMRVEKVMQSYQFPTMLTRRSDEYVSLQNRVLVANSLDNTVFVSVHFNHAGQGSVSGVETFYADQKVSPDAAWTWVGLFNSQVEPALDTGETLAGYIQTSLAGQLNLPNRGIKARSLHVVRNVRGPAVLVEAGFISNSLEAQMLRNEDYRDRLAASIANGILNFHKSRQQSPQPAGGLVTIKH